MKVKITGKIGKDGTWNSGGAVGADGQKLTLTECRQVTDVYANEVGTPDDSTRADVEEMQISQENSQQLETDA